MQARELIRIKKLIVLYFARHTGKPPETVEKDLERDYYMSAGMPSSTVSSTRS